MDLIPPKLIAQSASHQFATNSTVDQVLSIDELLSLIFGFMSQGCNAVNARVCKKWSVIALDRLWRKVTDISCLLSTLAPFSKSGYKVSEIIVSLEYEPHLW